LEGAAAAGFGFATLRRVHTVVGVRRLKAVVVVLVLAVWSACTVRCAIENLSGGADLPCCNDAGGQSDQAPKAAGQCVCSAIQAGGYVSQDSAVSIPLHLDDFALIDFSPRDEEQLPPRIVEVALSPLEFQRLWQFSLRAAMPARAPSLIS
jgi:hypothetical protein